MATHGGRPSERKKIRIWATRQPAPGKSWEGWTAGLPVRVCAHIAPRTKVCVKKYLGEKALCMGCGGGLRRDDVFYQPLYSEVDDVAVVVLFHYDQFDLLDCLPTHTKVKVGRGTSPNRGSYIKRLVGEPLYSTDREDRQAPQDICDWLPLLWKLGNVITGDMIRRGPLDEIKVEETVAIPPMAARVEEMFDKMEFKLDEQLEDIGSIPPGEAKKKRQERNKKFIEHCKAVENDTNGKH